MKRLLISVLILMALLLGPVSPVLADDIGGEGDVNNIDPVISSVSLRDAGDVGDVTALDPETEYLVKFAVADDNSMYDITTVTVELYFGDDNGGAAGITDYYTFTYTESSNDWASTNGASYLDPSTSSTVPSDRNLGSFAFKLYFKVDGVTVASGTAANDTWNIKITATDDSAVADTDTSLTFDVNLYKAIDSVSSVTFTALNPGATLNEQDVDPTVSANHQIDIKLTGSNLTTTGDGPTTILATTISYDDAATYTTPLGTLPTSATAVYTDYNESSFSLTAGAALTANTSNGGYTDGELKYIAVKGTSTIPNPLQDGTYTGTWTLTVVSKETVSS